MFKRNDGSEAKVNKFAVVTLADGMSAEETSNQRDKTARKQTPQQKNATEKRYNKFEDNHWQAQQERERNE